MCIPMGKNGLLGKWLELLLQIAIYSKKETTNSGVVLFHYFKTCQKYNNSWIKLCMEH